MNKDIIKNAGWDIGGAHVKLAYIHDNKLQVYQWNCPLWKGLNELVSVLKSALIPLPEHITQHHVTMTGELVDIFTCRDQGVKEIMQVFLEQISTNHCVHFFSRQGLVDYHHAQQDTSAIASANWIASGRIVSEHNENVIFVDIGSTTTDVLSIQNRELELNGLTDFERLRSGELVYTGVVRSCVNTLCREIPYKGYMTPLMAEYFAVSADVYRILEWLPAHADYGNTMDGMAKDKISSMRRLARMIGEDYCENDQQEWLNVAHYVADQQMEMIEKSIKVLMKKHVCKPIIVGAGVGRFLVEKIAHNLTLEYREFAKYVVPDDISYSLNASDCAPAVALVFV